MTLLGDIINDQDIVKTIFDHVIYYRNLEVPEGKREEVKEKFQNFIRNMTILNR